MTFSHVLLLRRVFFFFFLAKKKESIRTLDQHARKCLSIAIAFLCLNRRDESTSFHPSPMNFHKFSAFQRRRIPPAESNPSKKCFFFFIYSMMMMIFNRIMLYYHVCNDVSIQKRKNDDDQSKAIFSRNCKSKRIQRRQV